MKSSLKKNIKNLQKCLLYSEKSWQLLQKRFEYTISMPLAINLGIWVDLHIYRDVINIPMFFLPLDTTYHACQQVNLTNYQQLKFIHNNLNNSILLLLKWRLTVVSMLSTSVAAVDVLDTRDDLESMRRR